MTARTYLVLLHLLGGAAAIRHPLPLSTSHALEQREWRIASTAHANSYLFRVDRGEAGGPGIFAPAEAGACCGDSASRAWYVAATTPLPWVSSAGFTRVDGRPLHNLESWARRANVLIPGKVAGAQEPWRLNIAPSLVAALPRATWCVARWDEAASRFKPRGAAAAAACASTACDLQAYTRGFEPRSDVLLTDQVGTALLTSQLTPRNACRDAHRSVQLCSALSSMLGRSEVESALCVFDRPCQFSGFLCFRLGLTRPTDPP